MNHEDRMIYMGSRAWALVREKVKRRAHEMCERGCGAQLRQVHHLTYARIGHEELSDLMGLCEACHEFLSAKTDVDPVVEAILADFRAGGISEDGIAVFRRLYPQIKKIFKSED